MQDKDGNMLIPLPPVDHTVIPVTLSDEVRVSHVTIHSQRKIY
jgi:hypothetical protein